MKNTLYLPDSCPVLHVRDDIEVCSWHHKHAWSFYISVICHHLCFLLQLLRHEGGVPCHGDNGFSLRRCHRLLLPNQSEGMKRLLCLQLVRGRLLSVEKNLFVSCCSAAHSLNIHGICDQQQMQRFCCINGWRSCFRASLNLNFILIL